MIGTILRSGSNGLTSDEAQIAEASVITIENEREVRQRQVDEGIGFGFKSCTSSSSPITSPATSNSSPPSHRRSPVNTTSSSEESSSNLYSLAQSGVPMFPVNAFRLQSALVQPSNYYTTSATNSNIDNEKLRKLKMKKERKEHRKEKNVLNTFKVESIGNDDSYNVDTVLQSLGEFKQVEKKGNRKTGSNINGSKNMSGTLLNGNGSHNNNHVNGNNNSQKGRKRSNENQADTDDKKSTSDEEEEDESLSDNIETPTNYLSSIESSKNFLSSTVEFSHIQESFARNVVLVDETLTDVKRQVSRSTENLSSFTKVTKKQKRKKRPAEEQQQSQQQRNGLRNGQQQQAANSTSSYNSRGVRGGIGSGGSSSNGENNTAAAIENNSTAVNPADVRLALAQLPKAATGKNPLVQSQSVDDCNVKWSNSTKNDLDLSLDFPPLSDVASAAAPSAGGANVWPALKPSSASTSDSSAVIETSASEIINNIQDPPDLTVQANAIPTDYVASTALPDVASQTGSACTDTPTLPSTPTSVSNDEPAYNVAVQCDNVVPANDGASYFVDNDCVEIVVSEKLYSHREETSSMPAVTIFCKGETPLADWTSTGNFTFGFGLNEELLSMTYTDTDKLSSTPSVVESSFTLTDSTTTLTLNQEDNAIVSFGESLDDLKVNVTPESGISLEGGQDQDRSGTSTPQYVDSGAGSWADQGEDGEYLDDASEERNINELDMDLPVNPISHKPVKFNYPQILHFVRTGWLKVEAELLKAAPHIRYYKRQSCS